jgi:hypothetical protein
MRYRSNYHYVIFFLIILFQGCAATTVKHQPRDFERPREYVRFFEILDRAVDEFEVRNAASYPVAGFPYLRTNRFLTGLKNDLDTAPRREQWVRWLQQLDTEGRWKEIQNLPSAALGELAAELDQAPDRQLLQERMLSYSNKLMNHDRHRAEFFETLRAAVSDIDEYKTAYRVLGIYPITSLPVAVLTHRVQEKFEKWHHTPTDQLDIQGTMMGYGPPQKTAFTRAAAGVILNRSCDNALGIPIPSASDSRILAQMFAPLIHQDEVKPYDRIGAVIWKDGHVSVDTQQPTLYYYFTHARFKGKPILQVNFAFWYTARDGPNSPWIERGQLDGLTLRISLDIDGTPIMVDIMNTCGCYHFFVPDQKRVKRIIPSPQEVDAFVPRWLPESFPKVRLNLLINSGWHQVMHLGTQSASSGLIPYQLVPYDQLEMLPRSESTFESMFNFRGIAKDSGRIEFLVFFPMGIPDVGSMRQRGHHAIKLVGRSYFEDPDLIDKNFEFH